MCGDGTNDVGSLKSSTIGIAVLNNKDPKVAMAEERKRKIEAGEITEDAKEEPLLTAFYRPTMEES